MKKIISILILLISITAITNGQDDITIKTYNSMAIYLDEVKQYDDLVKSTVKMNYPTDGDMLITMPDRTIQLKVVESVKEDDDLQIKKLVVVGNGNILYVGLSVDQLYIYDIVDGQEIIIVLYNVSEDNYY